MSDLQPVSPGDPFKPLASEWNTITAAARHYRDTMRATDQSKTIPLAPTHHRIRVKNTTGADLWRGDCMGIDDPVFDPTDNLDEFLNALSFVGVEPTAAHRGKFVICLDEHPDGEIRWCAIGGIVAARVDKTRADDPRCDVSAGETVLKSGRSGNARILWAESGTGEKWASILIDAGHPPRYRGTLDADLEPDGFADVTVEQPDGTGGWESAGWTETDVGHGLPIDAAVPSGTVVWFEYYEDGSPWATAADHCE